MPPACAWSRSRSWRAASTTPPCSGDADGAAPRVLAGGARAAPMPTGPLPSARADHQPAVHGRADDGAGGAAARRSRAGDRHGQRLPGRDPGRDGAEVYTVEILEPLARAAAAVCAPWLRARPPSSRRRLSRLARGRPLRRGRRDRGAPEVPRRCSPGSRPAVAWSARWVRESRSCACWCARHRASRRGPACPSSSCRWSSGREPAARHASGEKMGRTKGVFALRPFLRASGASTSPPPFRNGS